MPGRDHAAAAGGDHPHRGEAVLNPADDRLHGFVFEHIAVRGAMVQLDATWRFIRSLRAYPAVVEGLLGEGVVASALLASTIKRTSGRLLLQMQGDGPLGLLLAECSSDYGLRCTARFDADIQPGPLPALLGQGHCAITLGDGTQRYQGIVPLEGATLASALEGYMARSEQLETRMLLFADAAFAGGLLLQRIPERHEGDPDAWNRVVHLGSTLTADELRSLPAPMLLRRLFPQDDVRLFDGRMLRFACTCSPERVRGMLTSLGAAEVEQVLAEQGRIEVTCEFCGQRYEFGPAACRAWFDADHRDGNG